MAEPVQVPLEVRFASKETTVGLKGRQQASSEGVAKHVKHKAGAVTNMPNVEFDVSATWNDQTGRKQQGAVPDLDVATFRNDRDGSFTATTSATGFLDQFAKFRAELEAEKAERKAELAAEKAERQAEVKELQEEAKELKERVTSLEKHSEPYLAIVRRCLLDKVRVQVARAAELAYDGRNGQEWQPFYELVVEQKGFKWLRERCGLTSSSFALTVKGDGSAQEAGDHAAHWVPEEHFPDGVAGQGGIWQQVLQCHQRLP